MSRVRALSDARQPAFLRSLASPLAWMRQPRLALALSAAVMAWGALALTQHHRGGRVIAEMGEEERWIEDTLDLLHAVDEAPADLTPDSQSTEDWWQELRELDETEWSLGNA